MFNKTTTDLDVIRKSPSRFTWGKVTTIHDIGRYTLVEYVVMNDTLSHYGQTFFHVYVDGKSKCTGCTTLESGLVYAMARGAIENVNDARHMARAACKVLDIKGE